MFQKFVIATLVIASCAICVRCNGCAGKKMLQSGGIPSFIKDEIVAAHNKLRQSVALGMVSSQPPAANMMEMVWDDELAATAQRWADQCTTAHDRATQRNVQRFPVGQNLAATWTTKRPSAAADSAPDFMKQINAWFDEVRIYGFKPTGYGHGTGHYSQLVWGETSHVGCGFTFYYDPSRGYTRLYVCNYGPGGNVIGSNPYEKGSPSCRNFGLSDSSQYKGLCSATYNSYDVAPLDGSDNVENNVIQDSGDYPSTYNTNTYSYNTNYGNDHSNGYRTQNQQYASNNSPTSHNQMSNYGYTKPVEVYQAPTFKPFVSLFKDPTDFFNSKSKFGQFNNKKNGFKFGTWYFR